MNNAIRPGGETPHDFLQIDALLSDEERLIRDTVREFVGDKILPNVAAWFEEGTLPKELAKEMGALGLFGMHLDGYGCAGTNAVSYGLACTELEAGDSGIRSFVSVQGSLAMFPIWAFGSEEQKQQWLPGMAAGDIVGCFGLTESDAGSDPGSMKTRARHDGSDWIIDGTKMWITNGGIADVAVEDHGFEFDDVGRRFAAHRFDTVAALEADLPLKDLIDLFVKIMLLKKRRFARIKLYLLSQRRHERL